MKAIITSDKGQSIMIGDSIKITVLGRERRGNEEVKIGISAPRSVKIVRTELLTRNELNRIKHLLEYDSV